MSHQDSLDSDQSSLSKAWERAKNPIRNSISSSYSSALSKINIKDRFPVGNNSHPPLAVTHQDDQLEQRGFSSKPLQPLAPSRHPSVGLNIPQASQEQSWDQPPPLPEQGSWNFSLPYQTTPPDILDIYEREMDLVSSPVEMPNYTFALKDDLVEQKRVKFQEPLRHLWYKGTFLLPEGGIKSSGSEYCKVCQDPFKIVGSKTVLKLGTIGDVFARSSCPICRLVYFALEKYTFAITAETTKILEEDIIVSPRPAPGAVILDVVSGSQTRAQIFAMAESELAIRTTFSHNATTVLSLLTDPNYSIFEFARFCLTNCLNDHPNCKWGQYGMSQVQILLIDVQQMCLRQVTFDYNRVQYIALSYVNGDTDILRTVRSNFHQHLQPNFFDSNVKLCRTVRDAIELTRALSIPFLWVDSLCIVQDDEKTKHSQIMSMNEIYSNAILTVVAYSGKSAESGLPGVAQLSRHPVTASTYSSHECGPFGSYRGKQPGGCIFTLWPIGLDRFRDISPYEKRAWTFQEKSLSSRTIYLSEHQSLFVCNGWTLSETDYAMLTSPNSMLGTDSDTDISTHLGLNSDDLLFFKPQLLSEDSRQIDPLARWELYRKLVTEYTQRDLRYPSDIINAFSGATKFLEENWLSQFVAGIPYILLSRCLFWIPCVAVEALKSPTMSPYSYAASVASPIFKPPFERRRIDGVPTVRFPSWSWAGWSGPVDYLISDAKTRASFEPMIAQYALLRPGTDTPMLISVETDGISDKYTLGAQLGPESSYSIPANLCCAALRFEASTLELSALEFETHIDSDAKGHVFTAVKDMTGQRCGLLLDSGNGASEQLQSDSGMDSPTEPLVRQLRNPHLVGNYRFILHSRMAPRVSAQGGSTVYLPDGGRVAAFDEGYSKLPVKSWGIYNVLVVKKIERMVGEMASGAHTWAGERVGVGFMHSDVWGQLGSTRDVVWLF